MPKASLFDRDKEQFVEGTVDSLAGRTGDGTETTGLKRIQLFRRLSDEALGSVQTALTTRHLAAGEVIFEMGDAGDELFIVKEGRIAIYAPDPEKPGEEQPIRIFEPPEALGEMALIDRQPRSLSARALDTSQVWVLTGGQFRTLLRTYPDMALAVMSGLNDRVRYTTQFLNEVREWVRRIAEGHYQRDFMPDAAYTDPSVSALAAEFAQMAAQVAQREAELQKEVFRLQIQVDQTKKERQVSEIVESDYFQSLRTQARKLRGQE